MVGERPTTQEGSGHINHLTGDYFARAKGSKSSRKPIVDTSLRKPFARGLQRTSNDSSRRKFFAKVVHRLPLSAMNIAVVDIGKPGANFGWAMVGDTTAEGNNTDVCVQSLAAVPPKWAAGLGFRGAHVHPDPHGPEAVDGCSQWRVWKLTAQQAVLRTRRCHLSRHWTGGRVLHFSSFA